MKVDMSPEAVTQRLRTLDELWLLSVKLMNSKKVKTAKFSVEKITKQFPISDLVENWYFRVDEISQGHYKAEGTDLYSRRVSFSNSDYDKALLKCVEYAIEVNKQIQISKD